MYVPCSLNVWISKKMECYRCYGENLFDKNLRRSESVESTDIKTGSIIANMKLVNIYEKKNDVFAKLRIYKVCVCGAQLKFVSCSN